MKQEIYTTKESMEKSMEGITKKERKKAEDIRTIINLTDVREIMNTLKW